MAKKDQSAGATARLIVKVFDAGGDGVRRPIEGAFIGIYRYHDEKGWKPNDARPDVSKSTDEEGYARFERLEATSYAVCQLFPDLPSDSNPQFVHPKEGCEEEVCFENKVIESVESTVYAHDCKQINCREPQVGDSVRVRVICNDSDRLASKGLRLLGPDGARLDSKDRQAFSFRIDEAGPYTLPYYLVIGSPEKVLEAQGASQARIIGKVEGDAAERSAQQVKGNLGVALQRGATAFTPDIAFWTAISNTTDALSFNPYLQFMESLFCGTPEFDDNRFGKKLDSLLHKRRLPFTDTDAYRVVKAATEAFVMVNCGTVQEKDPGPFEPTKDERYLSLRDLPLPGNRQSIFNAFHDDYLVRGVLPKPGKGILPYLAVIRKKLPDIDIKTKAIEDLDKNPAEIDDCYGILQEKLANPCLLELIWSYWHEEGMLAQTMNAVTRRFQNVRSPGLSDPLAALEIDPLRSLNNLLWGYIQDEQHRLTVVRRNYEYDHHYGLRLEGKAVQGIRAADTRSKFLEAFHNLLRLCIIFYRQDDDTTVKADAFPVLNALKEVHLILTEGQHNQFGDLPSTARIEMLMQQWFLARPEFREFLPTRISVAYPEPWMDRVDAMKKLQGWSDASVLHFRNLGVFGEKVLLSVRWGHWSDVQEPAQALNWARHFRPQIQGYIHAYRATTGVELAVEAIDSKVDATLPSVLLSKRLAMQRSA